MSYLVCIDRGQRGPIEPAEFRELADGDPELTVVDFEVNQDVLCVSWRAGPDSAPVAFVLSAGRIEVTSPSNAALAKMQEVAGHFGASVKGEEGEDLTAVELPDFEFDARKGIRGCLVILALIAALVWLLLQE